MQHSWLKFLHFFIPMTIPVYFYINYTKHTICYLNISVCFVLKASSWRPASKVSFYFILTPFPAMCKSVIWLLRGKFLLKFCPLCLQPAKRIGAAPHRRHRSSVLWQSSSWAPTQLENQQNHRTHGHEDFSGAQNREAAAFPQLASPVPNTLHPACGSRGSGTSPGSAQP